MPAGAAGDPAYVVLVDELGDLLYQMVFHVILAEEAGAFLMAEVAGGIDDKLVRRHPHVFGDAAAEPAPTSCATGYRSSRTRRATTRSSPGSPRASRRSCTPTSSTARPRPPGLIPRCHRLPRPSPRRVRDAVERPGAAAPSRARTRRASGGRRRAVAYRRASMPNRRCGLGGPLPRALRALRGAGRERSARPRHARPRDARRRSGGGGPTPRPDLGARRCPVTPFASSPPGPGWPRSSPGRSVALLPSDVPGFDATPEQVVNYTLDDRRALLVATVLISAAFTLLIVFYAGLRTLLGRAEGAPGCCRRSGTARSWS